jgi:hypothetical protein
LAAALFGRRRRGHGTDEHFDHGDGTGVAGGFEVVDTAHHGVAEKILRRNGHAGDDSDGFPVVPRRSAAADTAGQPDHALQLLFHLVRRRFRDQGFGAERRGGHDHIGRTFQRGLQGPGHGGIDGGLLRRAPPRPKTDRGQGQRQDQCGDHDENHGLAFGAGGSVDHAASLREPGRRPIAKWKRV